MQTHDLKGLAGRFLEAAFNRGELDLLAEYMTEDVALHDPGLELRGLDGLRQGLIRLRRAFPDFVATVEGQLAEGDLVAVRYRGRGTHSSEMFGIPATGRSIDYTGILMLRFANDRIAEFWAQPDLLGLLMQLGARVVVGETTVSRGA